MTDERRCLVLANQTLCGERLLELVAERIATGWIQAAGASAS